MSTCDCPWCVLKAAGTSVCDMIYTISKTRTQLRNNFDKVEPEEAQAIAMLVFLINQKERLRIDEEYSHEQDDMLIKVEKITRNTYKVCFHCAIEDGTSDPSM
jgi:hypothetical protein